MRSRMLVGLTAVLLTSTVESQAPGPTLADARAGIQKGNAEYIRAFGAGDAPSVAAVYDLKGARFDSKGVVHQGRSAIEADLKTFIGSVGPVTVTLKSRELWMFDGLAYEAGQWSYTFTPSGKSKTTVGGPYVTAWKHQAGGGWKIWVDIGLPNPNSP